MGLFSKLFGGKRSSSQTFEPATSASTPATSAIERSSTSAKQAPQPTPPQKPEYTTEELFKKLRSDYAFGCREGEHYVPQIDDLRMLWELKESARHPRIRYVAKQRYEELLKERRAEAKAQVARITDQEELIALAEDGSTEKYLREAAAQAVTDQEVLKRWAVDHSYRSPLSMVSRISDPADLADVARNATDLKTRTAATKRIKDESVLEDMARNGWGDHAQAIERLQGYTCTSCGTVVLPEDGAVVPCICPACSAANHLWVRVNNVREYRDYEVGEWHDECSRCGATANSHYVDTWSQ